MKERFGLSNTYAFLLLQIQNQQKVKTQNPCRFSNKRREKEKKQSDPYWGFPIQRFLLLLLLPYLLSFQPISGQPWDGVIITQADYEALRALKQDLVDPQGILKSWNDSGYGACSGKWVGIKCAQGQVIVIQLPWRGLGGQLSEKIGEFTALRKLSLHDNVIGGPVPSSLGFLPDLRGVQLFNNRFTGSIPPEIGSCLLLQSFDLSNNLLTGPIPADLSNSTKLSRLNLSYNALSGSIPVSLLQSSSLAFLWLHHNNLSGSVPDKWGGTGHQLQSLTLDHNMFSGTIPVSLSKLGKLVEMSLSHNQLSGTIPNEFGDLPRLQTLDISNNAITGTFPASLCNLHSLVRLDLEGNRLNGRIPANVGKMSSLTHLDLSKNGFTGNIPSALVDLENLSFLNVSNNKLSGSVPFPLTRKFNSTSFTGNLDLCGYSASTPCSSPTTAAPPPGPSHASGRKKLSTKDIILIAAGALLLVLIIVGSILFCFLLLRRRRRTRSKTIASGKAGPSTKAATTTTTGGKEAAAAGDVEASGEAGGKLVHFDGPFVFTADDLLCATAEIMGKSTYGTVYKATLESGNEVAVKRLREKIAKSQKEFEVEVNRLGKIRHPNLLALRAYYLGPKGEKLLVFDFMPRGSLSAFLHARGPDTPIDWATRLNIIISTARGLDHLHTHENMVHGNLTTGNILLDDNTNAKIADYGLSRLMTTAANSNVIATASALGYRAPELSKLKKANTKTDIYSLGVIILELLTGKSPGEAMNGDDLPHWVASIVKEEWTNEVFDLELMRDASTIGDELLNTLKLALHCVDPSPTARPEVHQVLHQLEEIIPDLPTSEASGDGAKLPSTADD